MAERSRRIAEKSGIVAELGEDGLAFNGSGHHADPVGDSRLAAMDISGPTNSEVKGKLNI